jgi:O-antigen ligase
MLKTFFKQASIVMDHSLFFRLIDRMFALMERLFSGSLARAAISEPADEDVLSRSVFVRVVNGFFGLLAKARERFADVYEASLIRKAMDALGELAAGSLAGRLFCGAFGVEAPETGKSGWLPLVLLGVICAGLGGSLFVFPPFTVLVAACGIIGAACVFARPEIGMAAVIALSPFIPTMAVAAMLGYITLCFLLKLLTDRRYSMELDLTGLFVALWAIIGLFMGLTSFSPSSSMSIALLTTLLTLSCPLSVSLINTKKKLGFCLATFSASAGVTGLYGAYQLLSGKVDMTWVDKSMFSDVQLRVYSTFANPNVYGAYLLLALPVCLVMAYVARRWWSKAYFLAVSALLAANLAYTFSRGCYIAFGVAVLAFILLINKRLVALFIAGLFAVPFLLPPSMLNRIASIATLGQGDSSTSYRVYIWQATLRMLQDFWISGLGQGIEAYNVVYPLYAFSNVTAPHSHNLYLQVFVETGIVGLLAFLGLLASFYKRQIPFFRRTRNIKSKALSAAFMSAALAFLTEGLFDYVFYNYRVMLAFFIFLGLGNALVNMRLKGDFC